MSRSRRRILAQSTADAALKAARLCRLDCIKVLTEAPIGSSAYKAAGEVMSAIDSLAEALTGNRELFWIKPHGGMARSRIEDLVEDEADGERVTD